jgi:predicted component of type VI protein secretion system
MQPAEHYRLTIRQGATPGKVFELAREVMVIGRDLKCDIVINDPEVSRNHTRLTAQADGYLVEDMESTNGTYVNSQRLTGPKLVRPGDLVGLGENIVLEFSLSDAAVATVIMQQAQHLAPEPAPAAEAYTPPPTPLPDVSAAPSPAYEPYAPSQPAWSPEPAAPPPPPMMPVGEKKSNRNLIITIVVIAVLLLCCCCLIIAAVAGWQYYQGNLKLPGAAAIQLLRLLI